jgi:ketosteroid isomerase-like protein
MSENLELVQSILAEWERGNFRSVDWAHPQIEYAIVDEPGSRVAWGVAAMTRTWREFLTAWDDYRVEAHKYRELDEERVLVALRAHGRGKASGLDIGVTGGGRASANVFHIRGGKVTRLVSYFDRDRALADVGLAMEGDPSSGCGCS